MGKVEREIRRRGRYAKRQEVSAEKERARKAQVKDRQRRAELLKLINPMIKRAGAIIASKDGDGAELIPYHEVNLIVTDYTRHIAAWPLVTGRYHYEFSDSGPQERDVVALYLCRNDMVQSFMGDRYPVPVEKLSTADLYLLQTGLNCFVESNGTRVHDRGSFRK